MKVRGWYYPPFQVMYFFKKLSVLQLFEMGHVLQCPAYSRCLIRACGLKKWVN